jgi:hypothetical protein
MGTDENKVEAARDRKDKDPVLQGHGETEEGAAFMDPQTLWKTASLVTSEERVDGLAALLLQRKRQNFKP